MPPGYIKSDISPLNPPTRNSDEQLFSVLDEMQKAGEHISATQLIRRMGGGSHSRLSKVIAAWRGRSAGLAAKPAPRSRRKTAAEAPSGETVTATAAQASDAGPPAEASAETAAPEAPGTGLSPEAVSSPGTEPSAERAGMAAEAPADIGNASDDRDGAAAPFPGSERSEARRDAPSAPEDGERAAVLQARLVRMQAEIDRLWGELRRAREDHAKELRRAYLTRRVMDEADAGD